MDDHDDMKTETAKAITAMAGRPLKPTKLTVGLIETIVTCTLTGASHRAVARMIGVSERTYRYWRQWGREGSHGKIYAQFVTAVRAAESAVAFEMAQSWRTAARSDWRAARAYLESRHPDEWGASRRSGTPVTQPPVVINVTLATGQRLLDVIPAHLALGETATPRVGSKSADLTSWVAGTLHGSRKKDDPGSGGRSELPTAFASLVGGQVYHHQEHVT